jgi:hypothetical protein
MRLHWIPVEPSTIVTAGLVLLAVLPHQIPSYGRQVLLSPVGAVLYAAVAAWVFWKNPMLGMAMFMMLVGLHLSGIRETFVAPVLNKDKVARKHRWFQEEVMMEEPHFIQERTEGPAFMLDEVSDQEAQPWHDETVMDQHPVGIQERPVSTEAGYESSMSGWKH